MSEDKRKSARTQGRFSSEKEIRPSRREKQKSSRKNGDSVNGSKSEDTEKKISDPTSRAAEGFSLEYQESSNCTFKELEPVQKPEEIRNPGAHQLSSTENGISRIIYEPDFLENSEAMEFMTLLDDTTKWQEKKIIIRGNEVLQPRLVAWYGPFDYCYSGAVLDAAEMPPPVLALKARIEDRLKKHNLDVVLNSALLNKYRSEKDSVAWHSDDELSMGVCPTIASVSLGAVRKFEMRPKEHALDQDPGLKDNIYFVNLKPGSLLIMDGCMQQDWKHQVPKEYHDRSPRINLTFRTVYSIEKLPSEVPFKSERASKKPVHDKNKSKSEFDSSDLSAWPTLGEKENKLKKSNPKSKANEKDTDNLELPQSDTPDVQISQSEVPVTEDPECAISRVPFTDESEQNENSSSEYSDAISNFSPQVAAEASETLEATQNGMSDAQPGEKAVQINPIESQLNANAPDFIPKSLSLPGQSCTSFETMDLVRLADVYVSKKVPSEKIAEFQGALFEQIPNMPRDFFTYRDRLELDVLTQISDGTQTESNQAVILNRICSIAKNANDRQQADYSPARGYSYRNSHGREYNQPRYRGGSSYNRPQNRR